jgi:hypothetical protein
MATQKNERRDAAMQDSAPIHRTKPFMTVVAEIAAIGAAIGAFGVFVQIGEYKANFSSLCATVNGLKTAIDANAAENKADHATIRYDLTKAQIDIATIRERKK